MESGSCFPTAPSAAPLPGHRALTWPPGRGQACAAAHRLGCQATWHHQAQTCGNIMSIWDQLPPTHPNVLTDIWKGLKSPAFSPQAKAALWAAHGQGCAPRGFLAKKASQQGRTWPHSLPGARKHRAKSQNGAVLAGVIRGPWDSATSSPAPQLALRSHTGIAPSQSETEGTQSQRK